MAVLLLSILGATTAQDVTFTFFADGACATQVSTCDAGSSGGIVGGCSVAGPVGGIIAGGGYGTADGFRVIGGASSCNSETNYPTTVPYFGLDSSVDSCKDLTGSTEDFSVSACALWDCQLCTQPGK